MAPKKSALENAIRLDNSKPRWLPLLQISLRGMTPGAGQLTGAIASSTIVHQAVNDPQVSAAYLSPEILVV
ncbi:hypothetical protein [Leptolyngbya sp. O-77]|uniref:hypothetical protein n=1 Tax=Leptolyngbya sp. O-77 TaxID=1080068 RepID=UPI000838EBFA|nr:hypothetical protein [Leptolyngbya sp. O-77]